LISILILLDFFCFIEEKFHFPVKRSSKTRPRFRMKSGGKFFVYLKTGLTFM